MDSPICFGIVRLPGGFKLPDAFQRLSWPGRGELQSQDYEQPHGTSAHNSLRFSLQANNQPGFRKQFIILRVNYGTTTDSYDCLPLLASFLNRLAFQFSELASPS